MPPSVDMSSRIVAGFVAVVCGAELLVVAIVGGAGLGVFFGKEGLLVAAAFVVLVFGITRSVDRRSRSATPQYRESSRAHDFRIQRR